MLHVYNRMTFKDDGERRIIRDAENSFLKGVTALNQDQNDIIQFIDQAHVDNDGKLIDRFGYKIRMDDISTGCKAALLVEIYPNSIIDTLECGVNALEAILTFCKNGYVIMPPLENSLKLKNADAIISVEYNGNIFNTAKELNDFIDDWE